MDKNETQIRSLVEGWARAVDQGRWVVAHEHHSFPVTP